MLSNDELGIGHAAIMQVASVGEGFDFEVYAPMWPLPLITWKTSSTQSFAFNTAR